MTYVSIRDRVTALLRHRALGLYIIGWSRKTACPALPIVGFGLLLAWTYVVFFSRLVHFSTRNSIEHLNSTYSFACCGIIAALVFYALPWDRLPLHRD